jgi:hypothetical protein
MGTVANDSANSTATTIGKRSKRISCLLQIFVTPNRIPALWPVSLGTNARSDALQNVSKPLESVRAGRK